MRHDCAPKVEPISLNWNQPMLAKRFVEPIRNVMPGFPFADLFFLRQPVWFIGVFAFGMLLAMNSDTHAQTANDMMDVWIGTGRAKESRGIYHCRLDVARGRLSDAELVAEVSGPGFLAMHPSGTRLYAVGTLTDVPSVIGYEIDRTGDRVALKLEQSLPIGDGGAAHVAVNRAGTLLLTAQYGGGSVATYQLDKDGRLVRQTGLIKHEGGSGVVEGRQDASHAHWAGFSPDQRFAFVPDLGLDQVVIYRVNEAESTLTRHGAGDVPAGGGPRHMKFHPNGRWVYVLNELALSVTVFDYDAEAGVMKAKQTLPSVNSDELAQEKFSSASEIRVHPNGRFVYSANRGHDTISVFEVDPQNGHLSLVELEHIRGATPRNFNLDPTATWLVAAGQDSNTIATFEVDAATGRLTYNRNCINAPNPICILFQHE